VTGHETVAVSNLAAGRVEAIRFESGQNVKQGQVLVELDSGVEKAQLRSAIAQRDRAKLTAERARQLIAKQAIARSELDDAETQLATAEASVSAWRAQLDNKVLKAPFAGRVGIRAVNIGQFLAPGTSVTSIDAIGKMYIDFSLPQEQLGAVRKGTTVWISVRGQQIVEGQLDAIDPTLDASTRTLRLRASVANGNAALRPGMFVTVTVVLPDKRSVVIIPLTAIVHAPYGDSVFVVEAKPKDAPGMVRTPDGREVVVVRQQFVRVGTTQGDFVEVVKGLRSGDVVVSEGAFKLRNGAPVVVDNRVKPEARIDPHPENR
jgi:membrane fusion protein, multidrug efflux system